jgi:AcrR family transcriptional regulator
VRDWIDAALDIMVEEGVSGVKIQRLCERLGVTKGSFYWHFDDLDAFLEEVARHWLDGDGVLPKGTKLGPAGNPDRNLLLAMQAFTEPRWRSLARAMRDWSQRDERARASMAAMDRSMVGLLEAAFEGLGFSGADSELRAKILYYVGVGFSHVGPLGGDGGADEQLEAVLNVLARQP